jgi:thiamine-monophosphate kinase
MNEFALIQRLTRSLPTNAAVVAGAGDDCAVLDLGVPDALILFKTDAVVEGIHFTRATPPEKIGRKALARCLSDIAAMAGTPSAALVTLGLPADFDAAWVAKIYAGLNTLAEQYQVAIVGGETTTNPERLLISLALLGRVARGKQILRSGAKAGDAIFVTGELGGSLAGRHLDFEPRLAEARWLADHFHLHAMLDVSDGLAGDLRHILEAGQVGAEILKSALPISRAAKLRACNSSRAPTEEGSLPGAHEPSRELLVRETAGASQEGSLPCSHEHSHSHGHRPAPAPKPAALAALTDGEDFELLFTVASQDAVPLLDAWRKTFPQLKLSCIGKIIAGKGLFLRDQTGVQPLNVHGYVHFA